MCPHCCCIYCRKMPSFDPLCAFTKNCGSISCLLYWMAWLNTLLSGFAFSVGFYLLVSYPYFNGIDTISEIILTPIGLVFVLEIDNWVFEIAKQCYPETRMDELWTFKARLFKDNSYVERVSEIANSIGILYYFSANLFLVCIVIQIVSTISNDQFNGSTSMVIIISSALSMIGVFVILQINWGCWVCCKRKIFDKFAVDFSDNDEDILMVNVETTIMEKYVELKVLYQQQQDLLNNMQRDLDCVKKQVLTENDDVLNKAMTEVLRMESVASDKETSCNI